MVLDLAKKSQSYDMLARVNMPSRLLLNAKLPVRTRALVLTVSISDYVFTVTALAANLECVSLNLANRIRLSDDSESSCFTWVLHRLPLLQYCSM